MQGSLQMQNLNSKEDDTKTKLENSKIIRNIWKNNFDKILEIKISNKRKLKEMKEKIMVEEKKAIEEKYNKEYNETSQNKRMELSKAKNQCNLDRLRQKNDLVNNAVEATLSKIKEFADPSNGEYKQLLKELTIECMVKLLEKECGIKVRKSDVNYMRSILKECETEFSNIMKKATKRDYKCKLNLLEDEFIEDECGGIIMMDPDKRIILNNSLKDRLKLTKEQCLPEIKNILFSK